MGRNWVTTKKALDEFAVENGNEIGGISSGTGVKLPVHIEPAAVLNSQKNNANQGAANNEPMAAENLSQQSQSGHGEPRLSNLRQEILQSLEQRVDKISQGLLELENSHRQIQEKSEQLRSKIELQNVDRHSFAPAPAGTESMANGEGFKGQVKGKGFLAEGILGKTPPAVLSVPEPAKEDLLKNRFISNFLFHENAQKSFQHGSEKENLSAFSTLSLCKLYGSFRQQPKFSKLGLALAVIISITGFAASVLWAGLIPNNKIAPWGETIWYIFKDSNTPKNNQLLENVQNGNFGRQASTTIIQQSITRVLSQDQDIIYSLIGQRLNQYLDEGKFKGEKGDKGDKGDPGAAGINGGGLISFVQPTSNSNTVPGSLAGITHLSSLDLITDTASVNTKLTAGTATFSGPLMVNGTASLATTAIASLAVSGETTLSGSTTIANLTVTGINPGLTPGSVIFQGASGMDEDNSNFFYDLANHRLGLGTSSPAVRLSVTGASAIDPFDISSTSGVSLLRVTQAGNLGIGTTSPSAKLDIWGNLNVATSSVAALFVDTGNTRVGIGTSSPAFALDVNGIVNASSFYVNGSPYIGSQWTTSGNDIYYLTGNVGIGSSSPSSNLTIQGTSTNPSVPLLTIASSSGNTLFTVLPSGNVGIGTTSPAYKLDVNGTIRVNRVIQFPTDTAPDAGYSIRTFPASQSGASDVSWWGYNLSDTIFSPATSSEPMLFWGQESSYYNPGYAATTSEMYLRYMPIGQSGNNFISPLFININRATNKVLQADVSSERTSFYNTSGSQMYLQLSASTTPQAVFGANVAIGSITTPLDQLHIGASSGGVIRLQDTTAITGGTVRIVQSGNSTFFNAYDASGNFTGRPLVLNSTASYFGNGNVGIGTTSPSQLLTVGNNNQFMVSSAGEATATSLALTGLLGQSCIGTSAAGLLQAGSCGVGSGSSIGWASSTNAVYNNFGYMVGVNSSSPSSNLVIQGTSTAPAIPLLTIASSSGSSLLTVLSNGNVGIGTTSPGARLQVQGPLATSAGVTITGNNYGGQIGTVDGQYGSILYIIPGSSSGGTMRMYQDGDKAKYSFDIYNGNTQAIRLDSNGNSWLNATTGNVGIGTSSPNAKLDVNGAIRIEGSGSNNDGTVVVPGNKGLVIGNDTSTAYFRLLPASSDIYFQNTEPTGSILFTGLNAGDLSGDVSFRTSGNIKFGQAAGAASGANVIITSSGNVGIGTTTPSSQLYVNQATATNSVLSGQLTLDVNQSTESSGWGYDVTKPSHGVKFVRQWASGSSEALGGIYGYSSTGSGSGWAGGLAFTASDEALGNGETVKMVIQGNGNVGIGTTSPAAKLDVWGNLNVATGSTPALFVNTTTGNTGVGAADSAGIKLYVAGQFKSSVSVAGSTGVYGYNGATGGTNYGVQGVATGANSGTSYGVYGYAGGSGAGTNIGGYFSAVSGGMNYGLIVENGNVGIGTTSPSQLLTVGNNNQFMVSSAGEATATSLALTGLLGQSCIGTSAAGLLQAGSCGVGSGSSIGWASSTNAVYNNFGYMVGVNSSSPSSNLVIQGTSTAPAIPLLTIASSSGSSLLTVLSNGNVGIGTTSPQELLHVYNGNIALENNYAIKSKVNNVESYRDILKTSTDNHVLLASGQWNDTIIYSGGSIETMRLSSGNVGIGTTSPGYKLDVQGGDLNVGGNDIYLNGNLRFSDSFDANYTNIKPQNGALALFDGSSNEMLKIYDSTGGKYVSIQQTGNDAAIRVTGVGNQNLLLQPYGEGNVSIGTSSPAARLSVTGASTVDPFDISSTSGASLLRMTQAGNMGIGSTSPSSLLSLQGSSANPTLPLLTITSSSGDSLFTVLPNGNVGIGVTNPGKPLSVNGGASFTAPIFTGGDATGIWMDTPDNYTYGVYRLSSKLGIKAGLASDADRITIDAANGNVGVGNTGPGQRLHVGSAASGGNVQVANGWLCVDTDDSCTGANTAGRIYANNGTVVGGVDVAEQYPTKEILEPGDVAAASGDFPVYVGKASSTSAVLGIISTKPGILLGGFKAEKFGNATNVPVALSGRVPVKVTNENGDIKPGDYLTASKNFPGYAMKATHSGQVIGQALENFDGNPEVASTTLGSAGTVLAFVKLGYQVINNKFILGESDGQLSTHASADKLLTNADATDTPLSFLINQMGAGNILQLQKDGQDRFLVASSGSVSILSNLECIPDDRHLGLPQMSVINNCQNVLTIQNSTTTLFSINAVGDITTIGHLNVGKDTAGTATIKQGDNQTAVTFNVPYLTVPKVTVSFNGLPDFFYGVADKTETGFAIQISKPAASDITFDWIAMAQPLDTQWQSSFNLQVAPAAAFQPEIIVSSQPPAPAGADNPKGENTTGSDKDVNVKVDTASGTVKEANPGGVGSGEVLDASTEKPQPPAPDLNSATPTSDPGSASGAGASNNPVADTGTAPANNTTNVAPGSVPVEQNYSE
ncbi:MAG: hypothetical protein M1383_05205 [Patescibacteria group bacterium]|nr:hypothetical protein [Patescibacteria group bacterium]